MQLASLDKSRHNQFTPSSYTYTYQSITHISSNYVNCVCALLSTRVFFVCVNALSWVYFWHLCVHSCFSWACWGMFMFVARRSKYTTLGNGSRTVPVSSFPIWLGLIDLIAWGHYPTRAPGDAGLRVEPQYWWPASSISCGGGKSWKQIVKGSGHVTWHKENDW